MNQSLTFHLIGNAHLDPVWLWDWREGLNEAIGTTRAMLDLMDEFPDLTVIRGETLLYEFLEREAPDLFQRVIAQVQAGRWELTGGTYVQNDNNLISTATLLKQFEVGQCYFRETFGRDVKTAWYPDSFGHSAGLPEIFAASGIQNFAHCRPFSSGFPISEPAYWWEGAGGSRVLSYRSPVDWYCNDRRVNAAARMDAYLGEARKTSLKNIAIFYGLGNHGGGPTRRILEDIQQWGRQHADEVKLMFSGLERYFNAVREELRVRPDLELPVLKGELNFCLRGCYVSTGKIKFPYRKTEHQLIRAERTIALVGTQVPVSSRSLNDAWRSVLFNSFHDILPGSSIERAYDDQIAQLGGAFFAAQTEEFRAINALARVVDTSVPVMEDGLPTAVPFLIFNPHEFAYSGPVELEAQLDWRPIEGYTDERTDLVPLEVLDAMGNPVPFQRIQTENRAMTRHVWRVRVSLTIDLPPGGWEVRTVQYREGPNLVKRSTGVAARQREVANEAFTVCSCLGEEGISISSSGQALLQSPGLGVRLYDDPYGSWGGLQEEPESFLLANVREVFRITDARVLEKGAELARLWVRFSGKKSRLDLTFTLHAGRDAIDICGRAFLDDRSCRMKMVFPGNYTSTQFEVPGGVIRRGAVGEVPGTGYVLAQGEGVNLGFTSDVLSGFNLRDGAFEVSIARASRYADDVPTIADEHLHLPAVDCGELRFRALVTNNGDGLRQMSRFVQQPVITQMVAAAPGALPRHGQLWDVDERVEVVGMRPEAAGGLTLELRNLTPGRFTPNIHLQETALQPPVLHPYTIIRHSTQQAGIA